MNSQAPSRIEKYSNSPITSSRDSKSRPRYAQRYQFEPPESIIEGSPGSIQRSGKIDVRQLRRSQSNLTINSQRRLIDPAQFSSQNPWTTKSNGFGLGGSLPENPLRRVHKSVSAASLATVRRLLKKDHPHLQDLPIKESESERPKYVRITPPMGPSHQPIPSQTRDFSSSFTPTEIVIQPQKRHPRLSIITKPESPLSIGGGLLHGEVSISIVDSKETIPGAALAIGYLSVDLVGVEICNKRHYVFQSLAVDLIDQNHPPPAESSPSLNASANGFWELVPAVFTLPFHLQLPEIPGPPPYKSRQGSIRYMLSTTAIIRIGIEETFVRDTCEVFVLGPHNPRVSLVNLPQPLNATDTFVLSRGLPFQDMTLRASLNRDVWASGMSVFVDVHVRNRSLKSVSKITISLERVMMVYHHPIAQLDRGMYRQSRLPDKIHRKTVASKSTSRSNVGWRGIPSFSRESRTWMLNLPPGLATINTGRFFGVRFFLKVSLHLPFTTRTLEAQLPVTILDPNSLDITSDFEALHMTSSRPRPSTMNSDLPPPSLRGPYGRRAEHRTPTQPQNSKQRRETWAWVTEVSPHPSLVPSPLLPTYGVPVKTAKTPSRLRNENKLSDSSIPHVPERLRPPLEEQNSYVLNRMHQIHTSEYPSTSTNLTGPSMILDHNSKHRHGIGTSTIASIRGHVLGSNRPFAAGQEQPASSASGGYQGKEMGRSHQASTKSIEAYSINEMDPNPTGQPSNEGLKVIFEDPPQEPIRSPIRMRKSAAHHRRAISRSKDVRAIYRPLSRDSGRNELLAKGATEHHGEAGSHNNNNNNGWETVENFF